MELNGKTALLTGATGGLGRTIAQTLASKGVTMVLSSRKESELGDLASALPGDGHRTIVSDLADYGAAEALLDEAGDLDILVANAGLPSSGLVEDFTNDQLDASLRVNLESPVKMAAKLAPAWRERGSGHMVFIGSLSGRVPSPRSSVYNATKFGLRGFTMALREDLHGSGVSASLISPGFIRDAGMFADSGAKTPPGTTSPPQEVGDAVVEAITADKLEIVVAPVPMKLITGFAMRHPATAAKVSRKQSQKVADQIVSGQTQKKR